MLKQFIDDIIGVFNNYDQINELSKHDIQFVDAELCNTIVNDKITSLPKNFKGYWVLESTYYDLAGKKIQEHLLFLYDEQDGMITKKLYKGAHDQDLSLLIDESTIDYRDLVIDHKIQTLKYQFKNNEFRLHEKHIPINCFNMSIKEYVSDYAIISDKQLFNDTEAILGFDYPIIYKKLSLN